MISHLTEAFRKRFQRLPSHVQQAREAYRLWKTNPYHSSLYFYTLSRSVKISFIFGADRAAVALKDGESLNWFWIGPHSHYDRLVDQF